MEQPPRDALLDAPSVAVYQTDVPAYAVAFTTGKLTDMGVPTFAFDGELYWGQDRIVDLEHALREAGHLRAASASPRRRVSA